LWINNLRLANSGKEPTAFLAKFLAKKERLPGQSEATGRRKNEP